MGDDNTQSSGGHARSALGDEGEDKGGTWQDTQGVAMGPGTHTELTLTLLPLSHHFHFIQQSRLA